MTAISEHADELEEENAALRERLDEAERVIQVVSGWNPDRVTVLEAIEPAARYLRERAGAARSQG